MKHTIEMLKARIKHLRLEINNTMRDEDFTEELKRLSELEAELKELQGRESLSQQPMSGEGMTAEEIMTMVANEHSYESWGELMYDSHDHWQVQCTKEAMERYAASLTPNKGLTEEEVELIEYVSDAGWYKDSGKWEHPDVHYSFDSLKDLLTHYKGVASAPQEQKGGQE